MSDFITSLEAWFYLDSQAVVIVAIVSALVFTWIVMRTLYRERSSEVLDARRSLVAAGGLLALIAIPVPVMLLVHTGSPPQVAVGEILYRTNCQQCHGLKGDRMPGVSLRSKEYLASQGDAKLTQVIRDGKGVMPAWGIAHEGPLDDNQITMIVAYLKAAAKSTGQASAPTTTSIAAAPAPGSTPAAGSSTPTAGGAVKPTAASGSGTTGATPGDATKGQAVFAKTCVACHGANGNQVPTAQLGSKEFLAKLPDKDLSTVIQEGKGGMPAFGQAKGGALSDADVRDVVAYLRSLAK